ncbi:MAG: N-acetylmuramoyl-L-alanine amidase CwlD [Tissierellaceae bacterium]
MRIIFIKKRTLYISIGIVIILLLSIKLFNTRIKVKEVTYLPITNRVIGIDPGHGGVDPGAVSRNGVKESDINLKIALKLKRFIEQSGGIPIMTREVDEGLHTEQSNTLRKMKTEDLINRNKLIEESGCELFVSIHMNSFTSSKYYGAQTFYPKDSEEGKRLAYIIQEELRNILDKDNRREPTPRDDVYLLKETSIPSVLVEAGFLSNPLEEKLLLTEEHQEKIAWCIYVGIMRYLSEWTGEYEF